MTDVSKFFYSGSPFIPEPSTEIMEKIVAEASLHREPLHFTVAMELRPLMWTHRSKVMSQISELNRKFGTKPQDIAMYTLGYDAPLCIFAVAFMAESAGDNAAVSKFFPPTDNPRIKEFNDHVRTNLSMYRSLLRQEPSGRLIFLNEEDHPCFSDIYYKAGVSVSKNMYIFYIQALTGGKSSDVR
jgi:hypothetical protein